MAGSRRKAGVLASQVEGYRAWLAEHGYTKLTIRNMLKDLGQVGTWLSRGDFRPLTSVKSDYSSICPTSGKPAVVGCPARAA